jgi:hypothetical protein
LAGNTNEIFETIEIIEVRIIMFMPPNASGPQQLVLAHHGYSHSLVKTSNDDYEPNLPNLVGCADGCFGRNTRLGKGTVPLSIDIASCQQAKCSNFFFPTLYRKFSSFLQGKSLVKMTCRGFTDENHSTRSFIKKITGEFYRSSEGTAFDFIEAG